MRRVLLLPLVAWAKCRTEGGPRRWPAAALDRTRFYAWVSCKDAPLLTHFLDWYLGLGLQLTKPGWARVVLHCLDKKDRRASLQVLEARDVHRNVHHNDGPFSAVIKTKDANVYLASLPRDALLVRADLDELFDAAPATIEAALREDGGFVRGRFVDRISGDWRLAPVAANRSLGAQFPRRCAATHAVFGGNDRKWILVPRIVGNRSVVFKTSHNVYDAPLVKRTSDVMHYRFDQRAFGLLRDKRDAYASRKDVQSAFAATMYDGMLGAFAEGSDGVAFRPAARKAIAYALDAQSSCLCGGDIFEAPRGAVYAATGGADYVDLAMLSASQLGRDARVRFFVEEDTMRYCADRAKALRRATWACSVVDASSLAADGVVAPPAVSLKWKRLAGGWTEKVRRGVEGRIAGILAMLASPFEETLFLDADTVPCFDLERLFRATEGAEGTSIFEAYDFLMAHEFHTLRGFLGEEAHGAPDVFGLLNAGVALYRWRDAVRRFLMKWLELYVDDLERKLADPRAYDPGDGRAFQRQPAMQWAAFRSAARDGLRVHALSPVWNARSWRPAFSGQAKRTTSDDCCAAHKFTSTTILVDHHCNASRLPACGARGSLDTAGLDVIGDVRHARPRLGCPGRAH